MDVRFSLRLQLYSIMSRLTSYLLKNPIKSWRYFGKYNILFLKGVDLSIASFFKLPLLFKYQAALRNLICSVYFAKLFENNLKGLS